MKVTESAVTKMTITGADGLDPITAIFEDFGPAQGKFMIECWGESWSHYWGAMGPDTKVREFFLSCDNDYLAGKCLGNTRVTDFNVISEKIGEIVTNEVELIDCDELMREHYGDDWRTDLPQCKSTQYVYLCKILTAIKEAVRLQLAALGEQSSATAQATCVGCDQPGPSLCEACTEKTRVLCDAVAAAGQTFRLETNSDDQTVGQP